MPNRSAAAVYEPPGFDMMLGLKDVRLALAAGEKANVPLPFANVLREAFLDASRMATPTKTGRRSPRCGAGDDRRAGRGEPNWKPLTRDDY